MHWTSALVILNTAQVWECGDAEQCERMGARFWGPGAGLVLQGGPHDAASLQRWHQRILAWLVDSVPPFPPLTVLWRTSDAGDAPEEDLSSAAQVTPQLCAALL